MRKFVILSGGRSGTSLLSSTLDTHPDLVCHGEVFHSKRPAGHVRGNLLGKSNEEIKALQSDLEAYMDHVFGQDNVSAVGFKMWRTQQPDIADIMMKESSVLKIIFERKNLLARFSSSRLAQMTGVFNKGSSKQDDSHKNVKIDFDRDMWDSFVVKHNRMFKIYRKRGKGPVLELTYEELLKNGFDPVLDFLGVKRMALMPQKQKLHGSNILERFSEESRPAVEALLAEINRPDWAVENAS